MAPETPTSPVQLVQDRALLVLGIGAWAARVVDVLRLEFDRLQVLPERALLHVWNPAGVPESPNLFQKFDAAALLRDARHAALHRQLEHVATEDLERDCAAGLRLPAAGVLALHANADLLVQQVQRSLDALRQANPESTLRLIVLGNLGEGSMAGAVAPLLFLLRSHLKLRRVDVELWAVTGEGLAADADAQRQSDLNCAAALQLWQRVVVGDEEFTVPGIEGLREERVESGPLVDQVMVFSSGVDARTHAPGVLASILATNLLCLESTLLDKRLQEERAYHGEDVLEQSWKNPVGEWVPTRAATFHVGGIKGDCLPEVFRLRALRTFVDTVTQSPARSARDRARAAALRCVEDGRLGANEIIHDLDVGRAPLTQQVIRDAHVPKPELHDFIKGRLDEDLGELLGLATRPTPPASYSALIQQAQLHCHGLAHQLSNAEGAYLPAAVEFYRTLEKELARLRDQVQETETWAQQELGRSPSRARLDRLLVRLDDDLTDHGDDLHGRFSETLTMALPIQIRKILEVAGEIREHARTVGTAPILQRFYTELMNSCEQRREALQQLVHALNSVAAASVRQEERTLRSARSAFTYQRGRFEELADAVWTRTCQVGGGVRVAAMLQRLGVDIADLASAPDLQDCLLQAAVPEVDRLVTHAEEVLTSEPRVRHALQDALLQLHPTVDVLRDRFEGLQTLRRRYVICSRAFLRAHGDLLEDHLHIETDAPWNIWITEHEEGFPFEVVRHVATCFAAWRDPEQRSAARLACATADLAGRLDTQSD